MRVVAAVADQKGGKTPTEGQESPWVEVIL
jgi:hypothetical protein